ncbi:MAG: DNA mismatch repair endonuclease MutL, partial [Nanoarchaeota archaeon]
RNFFKGSLQPITRGVMSKIKVLRQDIVEQIAAGEVVEDPSSVIKELVENALDADANRVFVEIEEGGKRLIRVTDDGVGMNKEDAQLALRRHATSKVESVADLFNIKTLGFRGEALAAISSVSEFELVTKTDYAMEGTRVRLENGEIVTESVACPKGTTIVVKNLFYSMPARKKHLRTNASEAGKIADIITKYAVINPLVYFRLTVDGKQVINSPNTASLLNNIVDIYGNDVARELLELDYKDEFYNIKGYISKPSFSRSDKDFMNVFVNGRFVKNKTIIDAVYDAYHTLLHGQRYPFALLQITIDPKKLDVNIHPNKLKIKIEQEGKLYEILFDLVRDVLKSHDITSKQETAEEEVQGTLAEDKDAPSAETSVDARDESSGATASASRPAAQVQPARKYPIQTERQQVFSEEGREEESSRRSQVKDKDIEYPADSSVKTSGRPAPEIAEQGTDTNMQSGSVRLKEVKSEENMSYEEAMRARQDDSETTSAEKYIDTSVKKKMRILGQIYKTYIVIESENGLLLMDQHAAHERVLFDEILNDTMNMTFDKQELLSPVELDLSLRETSAIESNKALLKQFGFELENFGGGSYLLRTVPVVFGKVQDKQFLTDLVSDLLNHAKVNSLDKMKREVVSTMACRAAIKAGDDLTNEMMKDIVTQFFSLDMSYTCPHGRPIMLEISISELEKRFKRSGF